MLECGPLGTGLKQLASLPPKGGAGADRSRPSFRFAEQVWQFGDVARYAACLIKGQRLGGCRIARVSSAADIGEGLSVAVLQSLVCMVTRCFLSMLTICGVQLIESARNFV